MAVIKEFRCLDHGEFEASHPICPYQPCDSRAVVQEFRTPPKIRSSLTTRTDLGLRRTADIYRLSDMQSAREGETSKPPYVSEHGIETQWCGGDALLGKYGAAARAPLGDMQHNSGMLDAANVAGITSVTRTAVPPSFDTTVEKGNTAGLAKAQSLLPTGMSYSQTSGKGRM